MDEKQLRALKQRFARSLDGLTVTEIADQAVRAFYALADEAEQLAQENEKLRQHAA